MPLMSFWGWGRHLTNSDSWNISWSIWRSLNEGQSTGVDTQYVHCYHQSNRTCCQISNLKRAVRCGPSLNKNTQLFLSFIPQCTVSRSLGTSCQLRVGSPTTERRWNSEVGWCQVQLSCRRGNDLRSVAQCKLVLSFSVFAPFPLLNAG